MIKPKGLQRGDRVAVVSPSSGMGGEDLFRHRYEQGKKRLEEEFGLEVITMPGALKGAAYLDRHPEVRADDLMEAFRDQSIKAIICMIGGEDSIRLLPHLDFEKIRSNPKIFIGYSDITALHFMLRHAGIVSYHGPCVMVEFAENGKMHAYTKRYINEILFEGKENVVIESSPFWTSEMLDWTDEKNNRITRKTVPEQRGFEILQGEGSVTGRLLGGCLGVMQMVNGTAVWPSREEWKDHILFLETAEDYPTPEQVRFFMRNLMAQGILDEISGIIVGKPLDEKYYDEYKASILKVVHDEAGLSSLPIIYNVNCSHTAPVCILPYGIRAQIDCEQKRITLLERAVEV